MSRGERAKVSLILGRCRRSQQRRPFRGAPDRAACTTELESWLLAERAACRILLPLVDALAGLVVEAKESRVAVSSWRPPVPRLQTTHRKRGVFHGWLVNDVRHDVPPSNDQVCPPSLHRLPTRRPFRHIEALYPARFASTRLRSDCPCRHRGLADQLSARVSFERWAGRVFEWFATGWTRPIGGTRSIRPQTCIRYAFRGGRAS